MVTDILRLARIASVCFPGHRPGALKLKAQLIRRGLRHRRLAEPFLHVSPETTLGRVMAARPQILGALVWPYQVAGWPVAERLARLRSHYSVTESLGGVFAFDVDAKIELMRLSDLYPGLRVVLDQPKWFMREGGLVLNLFVDDFRAYSLAFSLYDPADGPREAVIGSVQGRRVDDALAIYRDLTKALHGLRPRDMLLHVAGILLRQAQVRTLLAVSQAHRHHQHSFFANKDLTPDYDAIWADRGGERLDTMLWRLPLTPEVRDLSLIKPKKRSLYRKRYTFLDDLDTGMIQSLQTATPIRFRDT